MPAWSLREEKNIFIDLESWLFTKLSAANKVFCICMKWMHKCLLLRTKFYILTHTLVCINTGIFNSSIMTPFRIFFICFVNSFRTVSVGKSIIHQVHLVISTQNSKIKELEIQKICK